MAITKKRKPPISSVHDARLVAEGVETAKLPTDTYKGTIQQGLFETMEDIRVNKPLTWARINNTPMKTEFQFLNAVGNSRDLGSIKTLCSTNPEYSHFLLPRTLRERMTDGDCVFSASGVGPWNFILDYNGILKTFDDALDEDLQATITTMAYKKIAITMLTTLNEKNAKQAEYSVLLSGIQES